MVSSLTQTVVTVLAPNVFTYLDIDEISPDEDEVAAEAALHRVSTKKCKACTLENGGWNVFSISAILFYLFKLLCLMMMRVCLTL